MSHKLERSSIRKSDRTPVGIAFTGEEQKGKFLTVSNSLVKTWLENKQKNNSRKLDGMEGMEIVDRQQLKISI